MKDTDFEFMAGLATIVFMFGFLAGILITTIITTKSFKNHKYGNN